MKEENKIPLLVGYYFSRFDPGAHLELGYPTFAAAVRDLSTKFGVKEATLKNMRDEFDYFHTARRGWVREPHRSRKSLVEIFKDVEDGELLGIVREVISAAGQGWARTYDDIVASLATKSDFENAGRRVLLQPAGSKNAYEHYTSTVENPVPVARMERFLDGETVQRLKELYRNGTVPVWGVMPTRDNLRNWERIRPGDVALFSGNNRIFGSAVVSFTAGRNRELAEELWQTDEGGGTWEYIYFLDDFRSQNISYAEFNRAVGYKENNVIQGFQVLDEEKSVGVVSRFGLDTETYYPEVSPRAYYAVIAPDSEKPLDREGTARGRVEQAFLRKVLFEGKKYENCSICGREFPVSFLVAAHIKRRADCTDEERRDYQNIVAAMCRFGCDELYETGFLSVREGVVVSRPDETLTKPVVSYLSEVDGKPCTVWNEQNRIYFEWHSDKYDYKQKNT